MAAMTIEDRIERIRTSIRWIKEADRQRREAEADPRSDGKTRRRMKEYFEASEREFHFQWKNVEAVLDEYKLGEQ